MEYGRAVLKISKQHRSRNNKIACTPTLSFKISHYFIESQARRAPPMSPTESNLYFMEAPGLYLKKLFHNSEPDLRLMFPIWNLKKESTLENRNSKFLFYRGQLQDVYWDEYLCQQFEKEYQLLASVPSEKNAQALLQARSVPSGDKA